MADDDFTQENKRLKIRTVLDDLPAEQKLAGDPLLLLGCSGEEHFSRPYEYKVRLWRHRDKPRLQPADLINTPVTVRIKVSHIVLEGEVMTVNGVQISKKQVREDVAYVRRCGVFETFKDEGFMHDDKEVVDNRFRQYSATIVPPFRMMNRETAFRVFENKDAKEIIHEVVDFFPNLRLAFDHIKGELPKIEYCVQFGETSYNFLSRLMAEFGIWYYFDHHADPAGFCKMVLGTGLPALDKCKVSDGEKSVPVSQLSLTARPPNPTTIIDFDRVYNPASRFARFGDFNPLSPTAPFIGPGAPIEGKRDLIEPEKSDTKGSRTPPDLDDRFRTDVFPMAAITNADAQKLSETWIQAREPIVAVATGTSKNPALMPGFQFDIVRHQSSIASEDDIAAGQSDVITFENKAPDEQPDQVTKLGSFLVTQVHLEGTELAYHHDNPRNLFGLFMDLILPDSTTGLDALANLTNQGLNNYLQNRIPYDIGQSPVYNPQKAPSYAYFWPFFVGGMGGMAAGLVPLLVQAIEKSLDDGDQSNKFSCSFTAIPLDARDAAGLRSLPTPTDWVKPVAGGPHLAVVIGSEGTDTRQGEVFADQLGRVRVRFPWDRKKGEKTGDSFKRGNDSCWVRVSEGWAGRQFGTQFLPRIGQEVIVDFIAGDPDRPIVTGRVYNADRGFANLPFPRGQNELEVVGQDDLLRPVGSSDFRFAGLKTCSMPTPGADAQPRYHLTRFDDTLNCEQYLIRSQGRLDVTAFAHSFATTHGNRHVQVTPGRDQEGRTFGGAAFTTVGGEYDLHIGDNRYEGVDKGYQLTVKTDTVFDLQGNHTTLIGAESKLNAKSVVIEAPLKITLKVGSSFIVLDPAGVWIEGPLVNINSGGAPGFTTDVEVTDPADAAPAEPGDQWNRRLTTCDPHPRGGGGGRRHHTAHAQHGLAVTANPDGSLQVGPGIRVAGGDAASRDATIGDLAQIDQTPAGHALIGRLNSSGHTTTIQPRPPGSTVANTGTGFANQAASRAPGTPGTTDAAGHPLPGAGTGSDATISYNPSDFPIPGTRTNAPSDVALFHEMTHADHGAHGTRDKTPRADGFDNQEEFNTIQDENQYRNERGPWPGMPADNQRHDHSLRGL